MSRYTVHTVHDYHTYHMSQMYGYMYMDLLSFVFTDVTQEYTITHNTTAFAILVPTQIIQRHGYNCISL